MFNMNVVIQLEADLFYPLSVSLKRAIVYFCNTSNSLIQIMIFLFLNTLWHL